jgi:hypothetical protein
VCVWEGREAGVIASTVNVFREKYFIVSHSTQSKILHVKEGAQQNQGLYPC